MLSGKGKTNPRRELFFMCSHDIKPEWKIVLIGRDSFATVSILSGRPVAFKQVIFSDRTPELKTEVEALRCLYDFCNNE